MKEEAKDDVLTKEKITWHETVRKDPGDSNANISATSLGSTHREGKLINSGQTKGVENHDKAGYLI